LPAKDKITENIVRQNLKPKQGKQRTPGMIQNVTDRIALDCIPMAWAKLRFKKY